MGRPTMGIKRFGYFAKRARIVVLTNDTLYNLVFSIIATRWIYLFDTPLSREFPPPAVWNLLSRLRFGVEAESCALYVLIRDSKLLLLFYPLSQKGRYLATHTVYFNED